MKQFNQQTLYLDERITATLEMLDALYSAVSDGLLRLTHSDEQRIDWSQEKSDFPIGPRPANQRQAMVRAQVQGVSS